MVGLLGRVINPVATPLPTQDDTNTEERGQSSMPRVGYKPKISVFEQAKTFHAVDRTPTVMDSVLLKIDIKLDGQDVSL
jgi:hypothetical protein